MASSASVNPLQAPEGQRLALLVEGGVVPVYMLPGGGERSITWRLLAVLRTCSTQPLSRSLRTSWEQALGVCAPYLQGR